MGITGIGEPGSHCEDVLNAILAQIISCTGLDSSLVIPVKEEYPQLKIAKSVQMITVFPSQFVPDIGQQSGGSQATFVLDSVFIIKIHSSYLVDQTGQALKWLTDASRGAFPLMRKLMLGDGSIGTPQSGLEQNTLQFPAGNPKAGQNILEEPMRLSPGGWTVDGGQESGMGALRSEWLCSFIAAP